MKNTPTYLDQICSDLLAAVIEAANAADLLWIVSWPLGIGHRDEDPCSNGEPAEMRAKRIISDE